MLFWALPTGIYWFLSFGEEHNFVEETAFSSVEIKSIHFFFVGFFLKTAVTRGFHGHLTGHKDSASLRKVKFL